MIRATKPEQTFSARVQRAARPGMAAFAAGVAAVFSLALPADAQRKPSIAVLVNDEPITTYAVTQRQRLMGLGNQDIRAKAEANFKAALAQKSTTDELKKILRKVVDQNPGASRDKVIGIFNARKKTYAQGLQKRAVQKARSSVVSGLRSEALNELIDERLKLQEAKKLNALVGKEEVDKVIAQMAGRNKMDSKQFANHLKGMGADVSSMRDRFKAMLSWRNVIRVKFGHQISTMSGSIDQYLDTDALPSAPQSATLTLQRVTLRLGGGLDQGAVARRLQEAANLRQRHQGCGTTAALSQTAAGAQFEDLGARKAETIAEPTRSMLLAAKTGEMLPPSVGTSGVELWVMCERRAEAAAGVGASAAPAPKADDERQKEFGIRSKSYLKDLRQDAHIEYRE